MYVNLLTRLDPLLVPGGGEGPTAGTQNAGERVSKICEESGRPSKFQMISSREIYMWFFHEQE